VGFAVCAFHHGYCPSFEIDRCTFSGLNEGVEFLGEVVSFHMPMKGGKREIRHTYSSCGVGRCEGSFIKHFVIISSKILGNASLLGSFGAGSNTICCRRSKIPCGPPGSSALSLLNGNLPIASSISVKPTLHTSDLTVYCAPWIRSGAMYVPVPTKVSATEPSSSDETPKSQSLMYPREFTRMLEGLMSRCIIRCVRQRYVRPPRTASAILPRTSTRTGPKFLEIASRDLVNIYY